MVSIYLSRLSTVHFRTDVYRERGFGRRLPRQPVKRFPARKFNKSSLEMVLRKRYPLI
jgi:hypothetical protein